MPKHRKEAVRGLRLPVVPLMGGLALAGGAALLLSGPGGTSPLASLDVATQSKTLEYDVSLVNTEFSTDVLCFGQAGCNGIGGGFGGLFGGGGGNLVASGVSTFSSLVPGGGGAGLFGNGAAGTDAHLVQNANGTYQTDEQAGWSSFKRLQAKTAASGSVTVEQAVRDWLPRP